MPLSMRSFAVAATLFVAIPSAFTEGLVTTKPQQAGFANAGLDDRFQEIDRIGRHPRFFVRRCAAAPSW
jgi:hypothetical protein